MEEVSSERSRIMAAIKGKGTGPELVVRRWLWGRGFRYRLNYARLPGHPDLVLRKYRTCVFVNGCFWHGHGCGAFRLPKTRTEFWRAKIARNQERDERRLHELARMGWHVITIWECELAPSHREETLRGLEFTLNHLYLQDRLIERPAGTYDFDQQAPIPRAAEGEADGQ